MHVLFTILLFLAPLPAIYVATRYSYLARLQASLPGLQFALIGPVPLYVIGLVLVVLAIDPSRLPGASGTHTTWDASFIRSGETFDGELSLEDGPGAVVLIEGWFAEPGTLNRITLGSRTPALRDQQNGTLYLPIYLDQKSERFLARGKDKRGSHQFTLQTLELEQGQPNQISAATSSITLTRRLNWMQLLLYTILPPVAVLLMYTIVQNAKPRSGSEDTPPDEAGKASFDAGGVAIVAGGAATAYVVLLLSLSFVNSRNLVQELLATYGPANEQETKAQIEVAASQRWEFHLVHKRGYGGDPRTLLDYVGDIELTVGDKLMDLQIKGTLYRLSQLLADDRPSANGRNKSIYNWTTMTAGIHDGQLTAVFSTEGQPGPAELSEGILTCQLDDAGQLGDRIHFYDMRDYGRVHANMRTRLSREPSTDDVHLYADRTGINYGQMNLRSYNGVIGESVNALELIAESVNRYIELAIDHQDRSVSVPWLSDVGEHYLQLAERFIYDSRFNEESGHRDLRAEFADEIKQIEALRLNQ